MYNIIIKSVKLAIKAFPKMVSEFKYPVKRKNASLCPP